jgi:hypothetical protein
MTTNVISTRCLVILGLFVMGMVIPTFTSADCNKDRYGDVYCGAGKCMADVSGVVWCSRYYEGDAERMSDGSILCGKGHCMKRSDGRIFCSTAIGGTVLLDSRGDVRCYGQCEPATVEMCENTIAGSSNS